MRKLARPAALPSTIAALDRALSAGGASELDPAVPAAVWRRALAGPAAEFLSRPGKGLRSAVVHAGWELGGGEADAVPDRLALVIELLHAGSLIVDDVQDGSETRRDAPCLHRIVGVPLAINTGSWMYFWALAELAELGLPPATELAAQRAATTTLVRCHQGQALDLATRICDLDPESVGAVVAATTRLKTGALFRFAAELGAIAAGAPPEITGAIGRFGETMGIGLQMLDDLGSIVSPARRSKGHEDLREGRPTWPWAWLAERDRFAWARCCTLARAVTAGTGDVNALADTLAEAIGDVGRVHTEQTIDHAFHGLVDAVGASPVTEMVGAELARMKESYG